MWYRTKVLKDLKRIEQWLRDRGAEVLGPTNDWEVLRFKANGQTSVVYRNSRSENLACTGEAHTALSRFYSGESWSAGVPKSKRSQANRNAKVNALLARDGESCFYCGGSLGEDITVEHLVARASGGPEHIANMVLAHAQCNHGAGTLSAFEKIKLRERSIYADHHSTQGEQAAEEPAKEGADPPW